MSELPPFGATPEPPYVDFDGHRRFLTALPQRAGQVSAPPYRSANPVIPRSQWIEVDYSCFSAPILDQNGYNACAGHAGATTFTREWSRSGRTFHQFSAWYLYTQTCGGWDWGANIGDCVRSMADIGMVDDGMVPHGVYKKRDIPPGCDDQAKRFRLADAYEIQSFDEMISALILDFVVYFGIMVGNGFYEVDAGGVPGVGGRGGHALHGCGVVKVKAGPYKDRFAVRTQNSWGETYGDGGFCNLVEEHFQGSGFGCYAVRGLIDDPQDPLNPPPLVAGATFRPADAIGFI